MFNPDRPPAPTRDTFCRIVLQEVGKPGEERIRAYHSSAFGREWVGKSLHWCGIFGLWGLHESGIALSVFWRMGGGFCEEQRLTRVKLPEPGDIAYFDKPFQHHAVVVAVDADAGTFDSCDGNQPGDTVQHKTGIPLVKPTCFYSIAKLLERDTDPAPEPE